MRCTILPLAVAMMLLSGVAVETNAQCPTVSDVSPNIIGRAINPPTCYWNMSGDIADGDRITIDTTGANLTFEFDSNASVAAGNIAVTMPPPPNNRDEAREALIQTVNTYPSSPCRISCDYSGYLLDPLDPDYEWDSSKSLPDYLAVVWKGETSGYGATNSKSGAKIQVRPFSHYGNAYSYILLTGTSLDKVTGAKLVHPVTADELPAKNMNPYEYQVLLYKFDGGTKLGFAVTAAPDGINPLTQAPALGQYDIVLTTSTCGTVTVPAAVEVVDNLINDPTFFMNFIGNTNYNGWYGGFDHPDVWPGPLWEHDNTPGTGMSKWDFRKKSSVYEPGDGNKRDDPWRTLDSAWGSIGDDRAGVHEVRQTIPVNFTEPTTVTIKGMWAGGTSAEIEYGVKLYDQNSTLIMQEGPNTEYDWVNATPPNCTWADFWATGVFPADTTEIQVVFYLDIKVDWVQATIHFDDVLLFEGELCSNPPAITSISPQYGVRDDSSEEITITGSGFVNGQTTAKLYNGCDNVLDPVSVSVNSATEMTATFDLTGLDRDYWGVMVQTGDCIANLPDAFNVVLAGPSLTNGSFELPEYTRPDPCQYGTYTDVAADDWTSIHIHPYGGGSHYRDGNGKGSGDIPWDVYLYAPTCLPPDGLHWASVSAPYSSGAGARRMTQTVTVNPGSTYTLSGFFAAGGPNNLSISLLEGGYQGGLIAEEEILSSGDADWTFGYVSGPVAGGIVTAVWDTDNDAEGWKVGHADDLVLEECTGPVAVTAISVTSAASDGVLEDVTITGSGFSGSPVVYLVREGKTVAGFNVVADSDSSLTCDFDLSDAGMGPMDVIVGNNGCYATLADDAIVTAPSQLLNPEFEDPTIWDGQNPPEPALPCLGGVSGDVDGWMVSDLTKFRRDGTEHATLLPCPCPSSEGGHYATLSTDQAETLQVWQVLKVVPGRNYRVGAWFAGGGDSAVTLRLIDGMDPAGTEISSKVVATSSGSEEYLWLAEPGTVQGQAIGEFMTVVWELTCTGAIASSHADGFYVESPCNTPFADTDADRDVDQEDFGFFQICYTGPDVFEIPTEPAYCNCLDVEGGVEGGGDGDIDQADLSLFEDCASGPDVESVCTE